MNANTLLKAIALLIAYESLNVSKESLKIQKESSYGGDL